MNSSVLRVLAVILALGAAVVGYMGYQVSKQAPVTKPVQVKVEAPVAEPVLVAARDIPDGHILSEQDLTIELQSKRPSHSYSIATEVIGRQVKSDIDKGAVILPTYFPSFSLLAENLKPGERAMAVRVDEVIGTGGFIEPGDYVDVLFYLHSSQEVGKNSSAQVLLSNVRVLAFGNQIEEPDDDEHANEESENELKEAISGTKEKVKKKGDEKPTGKKSKTAVLAIDKSKTSTLLLAETSGKLRLVIHGPDTENTNSESLSGMNLLTPVELKQGVKKKEIEDKHYVLLKELIQNSAHENKTRTKKTQSHVIVHKGHLTETQAFRR